MIPARLVRTVPEVIDQRVERYWQHACGLHVTWEHVTWRDPIDPINFPLTHDDWPRCSSGAQFAGLIRLEDLYHRGGIYLDSDVQLFRSLEPFRRTGAFAAWEDDNVIPDAVLGAEPHHDAISACLALALDRLRNGGDDWRTGRGAWATGPGVTSTIFPGREDVLVLSPESFYPVHYTKKEQCDGYLPRPWTFGMHRWHASWVAPT